MALLLYDRNGKPKNEAAVKQCKAWGVETLQELKARRSRVYAAIAAKKENRSLEPRNCGTGAGGFKLDNTCAAGGDGEPSSDKPSQPEKRPEGGYTDKIRGAIDKEMAARGLDPEKSYTRARGLLDLPAAEVVQSIAAEQQAQNGKPLSKEAKASYDAFKSELLDQYNALVEAGLRPIPFEGKGEPYNAGPDKLWTPSSEVMRKEVERTGDFYFFKTQTGFGEEGSKPTEGHPLLEVSPAKDANGSPLLWNDVFRVVHDNVAHIRGGFGFNTKGEMNGMIAHASTLTPAARPALFAETFAQNSVFETTKKFAAQNAFAPSPASMAVLDDLLAKAGKLTGTNQRAMPDEDRDDDDEDMPTGPGRLRRQPHGDDASEGTELEADDEASESRNCGTGKGGFQPGNDCAKGRHPGEPAAPGSPVDARGEPAKRVTELLLAGHNVTVRAKDIDKIFRKMAARDENPDITNLVIQGTTLFGGEGLGVARGDMPQLGDNIEGFREQLRAAGISSEDVQISPMPIKPVQKEISGRKAGIKYLKITKKGRDAIKPVIVSRDGFVIDGHHGWAASVARAAKSAGYKMNAIVLDADHQTALRHAHEWMASQGVQPKTLDTREMPNCGTGAGGFKENNTCAKGGGAIEHTMPESKYDDPSNRHSWVSPSGSFHAVGHNLGDNEFMDHDRWAKKHGVAGGEKELQQNGWARLMGVSGNVYISNISGNGPSQKQISSAKDFAIAGGYDSLIVDRGPMRGSQTVWQKDESRNCGTGAGGFKENNTCAAGGDGDGHTETDEGVIEVSQKEEDANVDTFNWEAAMPRTDVGNKWSSVISQYTGNIYREVNEQFRTWHNSGVEPGGRAKDTERAVHEIAAAANPQKKELISYRGIYGDYGKAVAQEVKVGQIFKEAGIMSTSAKFSTGVGFTTPGPGVLVKVRGRNGAPIYALSQSPSEREVLYPDSSVFRITSVTHGVRVKVNSEYTTQPMTVVEITEEQSKP